MALRKQNDGRTDGWIGGWKDGWMDGRVDGWMDGNEWIENACLHN